MAFHQVVVPPYGDVERAQHCKRVVDEPYRRGLQEVSIIP